MEVMHATVASDLIIYWSIVRCWRWNDELGRRCQLYYRYRAGNHVFIVGLSFPRCWKMFRFFVYFASENRSVLNGKEKTEQPTSGALSSFHPVPSRRPTYAASGSTDRSCL